VLFKHDFNVYLQKENNLLVSNYIKFFFLASFCCVWQGFSFNSCSDSSIFHYFRILLRSRSVRSKLSSRNLWNHFLQVLWVTASSSKAEQIISTVWAAFLFN